jgi:hypothetical protein
MPDPPALAQDNKSNREVAAINDALKEYYWPRHFQTGPVDLPSFIHRIMTDYADYERDVVYAWFKDMSPIYKLYSSCLAYGVAWGTPLKAAEAKSFQRVSCIYRV